MRQLWRPLFFSILVLTACSVEEEHEIEESNLDFCACMNPTSDIVEKCSELFPAPQNEEEKRRYAEKEAACIESTELSDFMEQEDTTEGNTVENVEEEEMEPVSEECEKFVAEYGAAIKSFTALAKKAQANPDNIELKIQYMGSSEEIGQWATKPMMFECSQNKAFKKRIEELNNTRDRLLSN